MLSSFMGAPGGQMAGANASLGGYDKALGYMNPYVNGGLEDYNRYRGDVGGKGDMLSGYGNLADYQWRQAALSPQEAYQNKMAGYATSPQAQYQTQQMQQAADRGGSASGMLGSGTYFDKLQRNQQDIIAQDQDRWFNNMNTQENQAMQGIQNFQGQEADYLNRMKGLTDLGFDAAGQAAQMEMQKAQAEAAAAQGKSNGFGNLMNMGAGIAGTYFGGPIGGMAAKSAMGSMTGSGGGGMGGGMGGFF